LILVVDDDVTMRLLMRTALEQAGFAVEEAENGVQGLSAFERLRPDLVLLDVMMPEMDGFAVCAALRQLPGGEGKSVLMVTGLDDIDSINRAYEVGATDFLTKPLNWTILGHRVRYMLRASRALEGIRKSEEALRESEERYRNLFENANDAIVTLALDGTITTVNQGLETMLGWFRQELIGQHYRKILTPDFFAWTEEGVRRFLAGGKLPAIFEGEMVHKDGSVVPVEVGARAIQDPEGNPLGFQATYRDISARRALQRSQENLIRAEKMADLGRLAAGIAHEMNTPLGASLTSLKLLQGLIQEYRVSIGDAQVTEHDHWEIAAEMEKLAQAARRSMEKAATYIRSLKLHTRDLKPGEKKVFSVLPVIEDVGLLLSHRLRLSGCTLTVSCTSSDPILHGDPGKLGQVLTNLIVNATDAYQDAGKDGGEISIEVSEEQEVLEIRVKDQGCGIAEEHREKIFAEFYSTKPLGDGTGLGLPIVRNIMSNLFGGTIRVDSVEGQGSTFVLRFPREEGKKEKEPIDPGTRTPTRLYSIQSRPGLLDHKASEQP
jgi:PAS domain S-box-containing protein